jgi:Mn2+/Fe2+ NRAMP family transporter
VIGPAAILLGTSIGSGEWLIGPAAVVRYGTALLGVVTVEILLQVVLNIERMPYTVSTGEPVLRAS